MTSRAPTPRARPTVAARASSYRADRNPDETLIRRQPPRILRLIIGIDAIALVALLFWLHSVVYVDGVPLQMYVSEYQASGRSTCAERAGLALAVGYVSPPVDIQTGAQVLPYGTDARSSLVRDGRVISVVRQDRAQPLQVKAALCVSQDPVQASIPVLNVLVVTERRRVTDFLFARLTQFLSSAKGNR
jgi:hypothetical protein